VPSTISQPSFVLRMLDLLQLRPGHRVFELGAGSGWNAALIAHLVGPGGHVSSLEIIPDVAKTATQTMERLGVRNVSVIEGDGGDGYAAGAPYDRAIFTAGAYDLPKAFFQQVADDGLMLAVLKNPGGGDNLLLLRKRANHFELLEAMPCGFVQLRGRHRNEDLEETAVDALPDWAELRHHEAGRMPFWWGGKGQSQVVWRTLGIRSFLTITEPSFRAFKVEKSESQLREEHYFGLWLPQDRSLVLAKDDTLIAYGNLAARDRLLEVVRNWVDLGMPTAASLALRIYPSDVPVARGEDEWLVKRRESQFLWRRPGAPEYVSEQQG